YCDVHLYGGQTDRLYHNEGHGRFKDVSAAAGITKRQYRGLAVLSFDYDDDGWPDIMVANDEHPAILWHNQHNGTFVDMAAEAGVAYAGDGGVIAGMGLDLGDLNRDGHFEIYESNFQSRPNILFQWEGPGWYVDRTQRWDLARPTLDHLAFGVGF